MQVISGPERSGLRSGGEGAGGFAYLLLTHKAAPGVEDLTDRLRHLSPTCHVVVHHDSRSAEVPWAGQPPPGTHLVDRGPVDWGGWTMIVATLRLLRYATDRLDAGWFVLLSGQHRPVVDLSSWEALTAGSGADAIVDAVALPARLRFGPGDREANQFLARSVHQWRLMPRPRWEPAHRAVGALSKLSRWAHPVTKLEYVHRRDAWAWGLHRSASPVRGWTFYRGSQWLVLNRRAADAILRVDPGVVDWFSRSWIPDETFLQTLLHNTPGLSIRTAPVTYVLDRPKRPGPDPEWMRLDLDDLPDVWASGAPFARKVDQISRPWVIDAIDRAVDRAVGRAVDSHR